MTCVNLACGVNHKQIFPSAVETSQYLSRIPALSQLHLYQVWADVSIIIVECFTSSHTDDLRLGSQLFATWI
jgi:hypothetical protein